MAMRAGAVPISRSFDDSIFVSNLYQRPTESKLTEVWEMLKKRLFGSDLGIPSEMSKIEKQYKYSRGDSSIKVSDLCQRLNKTFTPEFRKWGLVSMSGTLSSSNYINLQEIRNQLADSDLYLIWNKPRDGLLAQLSALRAFHEEKVPITLFDIKKWLASSANSIYLNQIIELDLSQMGIQTLPKEIFKLKALKSLQLRDNLFTTFPYDLSALPQLEEIDLLGNPLQDFPKDSQCCVQIQTSIFDRDLKKLDAQVICSLKSEQVLGIRVAVPKDTSCAWKQIFEFRWMGLSWIGEIPVGSEFRFVCIDHLEKRILEEKIEGSRCVPTDSARHGEAVFRADDVQF